jgi:ribosomal protein S18 acetylase RimI-like enzyme
MRGLLVRTEAHHGPLVYCHLGDLDWWRFTEADPDAVARNALLCFGTGDALVAFAWQKDSQVDIMALPGHGSAEDELLDWAEARFRAGTNSASAPFTAWSYTHDERRNQALQARGYERAAEHFNTNARELPVDPPSLELPPGYHIRNVRGEADIIARVDVHRDAFAPSRMTVEKHRAVMAAPTYRSELDLVVEVPDRIFAAYCLVWFDAANRTGEFEPVGCHSAYRRRGLTKAVMVEGMRRLRALGATRCSVISSGDEGYEPSRHLYASVGFRVVGQIFAWNKAA